MHRIRLPVFAATLATALAACGGTTVDGGAADPTTGDATVTAEEMAFEPGAVTVESAGQAFIIAFVNRDAMPHNIAIYTDDSRTEKLFEGEMVTDGSVAYEVPALEAGTYFFDCALHPGMTGTLVVEG